jgi:hypothetical protein
VSEATNLLIELEVVNDDGAVRKSNGHDVEGWRLFNAGDGRAPASKGIDELLRSDVPELKNALLSSNDNLVQVGVRMLPSRDVHASRELDLVEVLSGLEIPDLHDASLIQRQQMLAEDPQKSHLAVVPGKCLGLLNGESVRVRGCLARRHMKILAPEAV